MNIVLLGGNGYIGREVTRQWLARDLQAQFLVVSRSGENQLKDLRIRNVKADCHDVAAIEDALSDALPGGAGSIGAIACFVGGMGGSEMNVTPVRAMLEVAEAHDIPVMGYVGGMLGGKDFVTSKAAACDLLRESGRHVAIVEPTLVYGAGRSDTLAKMVPLMKFFGIFSKKMKPVRVEDVAQELIDGITA